MSSFSETLLSELNYQGKTQADLARFLNVRQSTVQQWIQRGSIPAADTALKISRFLNVSLEYLIDGTNPPHDISRKERNEDSHISDDEKELLVLYKNLSEDDREEIKDIMTMKIKRKEKSALAMEFWKNTAPVS